VIDSIIRFSFCCLFLQMTNTQFFALIATSSVSECMVAAFKYRLNISFPGKQQQQTNKTSSKTVNCLFSELCCIVDFDILCAVQFFVVC